MRKNMSILRYQQTRRKPHKALSHASLAKLKKLPLPAYKFIPETIACLLFFTMASAMAADLRGSDSPQINLLEEFRPIGGSGNNLENPELNVPPGSPEIALAPLNFAPRTHDGLVNGPNPRTISNVISGGTGTNGVNGQTTDPTASAWLYVFGQFVDHDLDLEATPLTTPAINIVIPPGDPVFPPGTSILLTRATRSPETNTIINTVAGYLDLSQLYGSTAAIAASLRNADGTLTSSGNGLYLPVVNGSFVSGDVRVMENPELTAVTTLFMREHNFWVRTLKAQHPGWTGDQLYNMAKAITTAEYENIVYTEYLPVLIGPVLGPYRGYNPNIDAQVTQEFSTAAFRLHTQISDTQEGLDNSGSVVFTEPLAQSFFNTAARDESNGINPLIRSLGVDFAQATDVYVVAALRNLLFENLVGGGIDAMDLIAIDIQRERDVGLGTLNQTRRALGLEPYDSFADLTPDPILQKYLQAVYGNINNVDLFIGGLAEVHVPGSRVGPTFQAIFTRQFQALRAGDRFFWMNEGFNDETTEMIANTTLADIILRNTDTTALQANVFIETPLPIPVAPNVTAPLAAHLQPHVPTPAVIDTHGRTGSPFIGDGW